MNHIIVSVGDKYSKPRFIKVESIYEHEMRKSGRKNVTNER